MESSITVTSRLNARTSLGLDIELKHGKRGQWSEIFSKSEVGNCAHAHFNTFFELLR